MNRFKLWFNRNNLKIGLIIILILLAYFMIKNLNNYYKNEKEQEQQSRSINGESSQNGNSKVNNEGNESIVTNEGTNQIGGKSNLSQVDHSTEQYKNIIGVVQKIITYVYQASTNDNNLSLKTDLYNMFTEDGLRYLSHGEQTIQIENILDFIFTVKNIDDYSVGNVYRYSEKNNVVRYAIILRYEKPEEKILDSYMIINMDYNNHTFSYDATLMGLDNMDSFKEVTYIENKGSNTF